MKRKLYDTLVEWKKESKGRTAILIDGARRVGKSYLAKQFAEENYRSYLLIDFTEVDSQIVNLFNNYIGNLDTFFLYLEGIYNVKLYPRESVIIFDEVQQLPKARQAIKQLVADGRYDYIETGSLMSIKKNVQDIVLPSEEEHIKLYPMDFEEFLWANDNTILMPIIKECFDEKKPVGQILHRKIMDYFRQYIIVGGMPQAVNAFITEKNFKEVDKIKRGILNLYREDIRKHSGTKVGEVEDIFDSLPSQLSRHNKKFKLSEIKKDARRRDFQESLYWLADAMIFNMCYNSTEPNIGLRLNRESKKFKCYFLDTGLLVSHCFDERKMVADDIYRKLIFGKLNVNEGMLIENVVAQMLTAAGHKLYFFSTANSKDAQSRMEIDFLLAKSRISNQHNISPVEVKSGERYTISSLRKFREKYKTYLNKPYVLHIKDLKEEDGILYFPLYMTMLL